MTLQQKRIYVSLDKNPNVKTTLNSIERLGAVGVATEDEIRLRLLGVPGPRGEPGAFVFKGDYSPTEPYVYGDSVRYDGSVYLYINDLGSIGNTPTDPQYWAIFVSDGAPGSFEWLGEYSPTAEYSLNQAVKGGDGNVYIYISETPTTGTPVTDTNYWEIFSEKGDQGDPGLDGDKHFSFIQITSSLDWTINHGLNKIPSVEVVEDGGSWVEGDVEVVDLNSIIIHFSEAISGTAYLN